MFEKWKLKGFTPGEGKAQGASLADYDDSNWLDVEAPGDVHRTLVRAGRLPDE